MENKKTYIWLRGLLLCIGSLACLFLFVLGAKAIGYLYLFHPDVLMLLVIIFAFFILLFVCYDSEKEVMMYTPSSYDIHLNRWVVLVGFGVGGLITIIGVMGYLTRGLGSYDEKNIFIFDISSVIVIFIGLILCVLFITEERRGKKHDIYCARREILLDEEYDRKRKLEKSRE